MLRLLPEPPARIEEGSSIVFDGEELLPILVLDTHGERVGAVGLVPTDEQAHSDAQVDGPEVAFVVEGLIQLAPPCALQVEQAVDGFGVVGEGDELDLRHGSILPYRVMPQARVTDRGTTFSDPRRADAPL